MGSIRGLAFFAMKLVSVGTSEADVERVLSVHRAIVGDKAVHMKQDVVKARVRLRTSGKYRGEWSKCCIPK